MGGIVDEISWEFFSVFYLFKIIVEVWWKFLFIGNEVIVVKYVWILVGDKS